MKFIAAHCNKQNVVFIVALVMTLFSTGAFGACLTPPDGYWHLDEDIADPSVLSIPDASGNGVDGDCTGGCPSFDALEGIDGASLFGSDSDLTFPKPSDPVSDIYQWEVDDDFSIELRAKVPGGQPSQTQVIIGRYDNDNVGDDLEWYLAIHTDGTIEFFLSDNNGNGASIRGGTDIANGAWHHIIAMRNSTDDTIELYVDGEPDASPVRAEYDENFTSDTAHLLVGTYGQNMSGFHFVGYLDEIAIYDELLSESVITQHYLSTLGEKSYCDDIAPSFISSAGQWTVSQGLEVLIPVEAAGNPLPSFELTGEPDGMNVTGEGTGLIDWIPTDHDLSTYDFSVSAENSVGSTATPLDLSLEVVDICADGFLGAYFPLDEADGTSGYADKQQALSNGECATNCPTAIDHNGGKAQSFGGGSDGISIPADSTGQAVFDWGASDEFTMEFSVKIDGAPGGLEVIMSRSNGALDWYISVTPSGTIETVMSDTGGNGGTIDGTKIITDNKWHSVAIVRDVLAGADEVTIYVDGEVDNAEDIDFKSDFISNTAVLALGWYPGGAGFRFVGMIDDLAFWDSALEQGILLQHAQGLPAHGYCNSKPSFTSTPVMDADEGVQYTYQATAQDDDLQDLAWELIVNPTGMTIDGDGLVTWMPGDDSVSGNVPVTIRVMDTFGGSADQSYNIALTAQPDAPVITGQVALTTATNTPLTIKVSDLTIVDPDSSSFTLNVQSGANYTVSGTTITPDSGFSGDLNVPVTVNDGTNDSDVFTLTVNVSVPGNIAPVITSSSQSTATVDEEYRYDAEATDDNGDTLAWSLSADKPADMDVDTATGVVTWTPPSGSEGTVTFTLTVSDGNGGTDDEQISLTVSAAGNGGGSSNGSSGGGGGGGGCFISTIH